MRISKNHNGMKVNSFNGGMRTRLASHLLSHDESVISVNVDPTSAILTPMQDKINLDIPVERYFFYYQENSEWLSFSTPHDFVEYQGVVYYGDREGQIQRYDGETTSNISIERPDTPVLLELLYEADTVDTFNLLLKEDAREFKEGLPASYFSYMLFHHNETTEDDSRIVYATPFRFTADATDGQPVITGNISPYDPKDPLVFDPVNTDPDALQRNELYFSNFQNIVGIKNLVLFRYYDKTWRQIRNVFPESGGTVEEQQIYDNEYELTIYNSPSLQDGFITPFFGTYQYVYTYYNKDLDIESAPSPISEELHAESGHIRVTFQDDPYDRDPQITHKRIYRIGGQQTVFTLVEERSVTISSFIDNNKTNQLQGDLLSSQNYDNPPDGLKYLIEAQGMFLGADEYTLRFTDIGVPHAWSELYYIEFEALITGLAQVAYGVLVFTQYKTYLITGNTPTTLVSQLLTSDHGCLSHDSIAQSEYGRVIWVDQSGLCTSNGGSVDNISNQYVETIEFNAIKGDILNPIRATNSNQIYYVQLDSGYTFIWDYRYQKHVPYFASYGTDSIYSINGLVYGRENGLLHELESSDQVLDYLYLTPKFIGISYSLLKTYNKVYFISSGDVHIKVIIDNKHFESIREYTLDPTSLFNEILIPQEHQLGYSIQFEISGSGTVEEIVYFEEDTLSTHYAE